MRMTRIAALAVLAAVLATVWASAPAAAAAGHVQVSMDNFAFTPASLTIRSGDVVTWTNHDVAPHDVTITGGPASFHSPMLSTGQSWTYTFSAPGTYSYICSIHPDMHATVTVLAAATPTPTPTAPRASAVVVAGRPRTPSHHAAAPAAASSSAAAAAPAPAATTTPPAAVAATTTTSRSVRPLLLVAGVVAAIATLCLLLLASRPDDAPAA